MQYVVTRQQTKQYLSYYLSYYLECMSFTNKQSINKGPNVEILKQLINKHGKIISIRSLRSNYLNRHNIKHIIL